LNLNNFHIFITICTNRFTGETSIEILGF